jgi:hypothetical protein
VPRGGALWTCRVRATSAVMSTKPKTRHVTLRVEDDLAEAIELEAARERRTTANLMRLALSEWLAARQSGNRTAAANAA